MRTQIIKNTDNMVAPSRIDVDYSGTLLPSSFRRVRSTQRATLEVNTEFRKIGLSVFEPVSILAFKYKDGYYNFLTTKLYVKTKIDTVAVSDRIFGRINEENLNCSFRTLMNYEISWTPSLILFEVIEARGFMNGRGRVKVHVTVDDSAPEKAIQYSKLGNEGPVVEEFWIRSRWLKEWAAGSNIIPCVGLTASEEFTWGELE